MSASVKRRLTCVLCADVQSYSRLMEADETGTLETLRRYRQAMQKLVERHGGRVVNTWGDAVIVEFSSVVEAVQCAIEIQRELADLNSDLAEDHRMRFRIGVNLGDIMIDGDDIYGEGVNIAARLQELAEPGGILISRSVFEQVHNKVAIGFDYLGEQMVKNVSEAVPSYRVRLDGRNEPFVQPAAEPTDNKSEDPPRPDPAAGAGDRPDQIQAAWAWFTRLPKPVGRSVAAIGFFFLINLFAGFHTVWFIWPSLPLILFILMYYLRSKKDEAGEAR